MRITVWNSTLISMAAGDFLLWAWGNGSANWVIDDVMLLEDTNGDIGGANAVIPDSSSGDGYDKVLFSSDVLDDPDGAWQRFADKLVELAVKKNLIGNSSFFWKVWADNGLANPALFDYNDAFTAQEAGSPACGNSSNFPVKDLSQMDSTCWIAFNHNTTGYELGGCDKPQPTAVPLKHKPTEVPTEAPTTVPTEEPAPACPSCGTYAMSHDCCVACGTSYVWDGTGCRPSAGK